MTLMWKYCCASANMRGLASSRQPSSGRDTGCAHGTSAPAALPAGAAAAKLLLVLLLLGLNVEATSWARKVRQSLSAPATGRVSGRDVLPPSPGAGCGPSPLPLPAAHATRRRLGGALPRACCTCR
jgi:hypothetical protein